MPGKDEIIHLAQMLRKANYGVALTGAGMSTESGLADFRSPGGLWQGKDPMQLASFRAMHDNYEEFREFYLWRVEKLKEAAPHRGHEVLAEWEKEGLLKAVLTQNVDGFHQQAGSREVLELHGNLRRFSCVKCSASVSPEEFKKDVACSHCNGRLRPGVVLFGEGLPQKPWEEATRHLEQADFFLVIGTSLAVAPVNQFPLLFEGRGPQVLINQKSTPLSYLFDLILHGSAGEILSRVDQYIKEGSA